MWLIARDEAWDAATQVEQGVEFDRRLVLPGACLLTPV
jgi:hypothetical protein